MEVLETLSSITHIHLDSAHSIWETVAQLLVPNQLDDYERSIVVEKHLWTLNRVPCYRLDLTKACEEKGIIDQTKQPVGEIVYTFQKLQLFLAKFLHQHYFRLLVPSIDMPHRQESIWKNRIVSVFPTTIEVVLTCFILIASKRIFSHGRCLYACCHVVYGEHAPSPVVRQLPKPQSKYHASTCDMITLNPLCKRA